MAEGVVQLPADGGGKRLRTQVVDVQPDGLEEHQEVVTLALPDGSLVGDAVPLPVTLPDLTGTPSYYSGTSGTVNVAAGERVMGVACHATSAGSLTIDGGTSIPVPANSTFSDGPDGQWVGPLDIVFTGTDSLYVRVLS